MDVHLWKIVKLSLLRWLTQGIWRRTGEADGGETNDDSGEASGVSFFEVFRRWAGLDFHQWSPGLHRFPVKTFLVVLEFLIGGGN